MVIPDFLKKLINWFLGKSPAKLETFQEEVIEGNGVKLIRYRRKQLRAYRTWRAVYKELEYDLIFGWDTLDVIVGVPTIHKENKMSTHILNICRQGLHARYNPLRRVHEPDLEVLVKDQEVCLEAFYMSRVVQGWRLQTKNRPEREQIRSREDVFDRIIDAVAKYAIHHPPSEIDPLKIDWREVVSQATRLTLGSPNHQVFPVDSVLGEVE